MRQEEKGTKGKTTKIEREREDTGVVLRMSFVRLGMHWFAHSHMLRGNVCAYSAPNKLTFGHSSNECTFIY